MIGAQVWPNDHKNTAWISLGKLCSVARSSAIQTVWSAAVRSFIKTTLEPLFASYQCFELCQVKVLIPKFFLQKVHILLILGAPELKEVLQMNT